jgi:Protein of unknown function (DUF3617)
MVYRKIGALCASSMFVSWLLAQTPQHGTWEVTTTMQGAPSGDAKSSKHACLNPAQIASGLEQAILDISAGNSSASRRGLKCSLKDIKREGSSSSWQSSCEGPRGAMQGVGSASIEANRASLRQSFEVITPFGAMKLTQSVEAQRVGDCK